MTLYQGVSAAYPGAALPAGTSILTPYIGLPNSPGAPDTPHCWTAAECNAYLAANPQLRFLPVYVHNFPGDPAADAANAAGAAHQLGFAPGHDKMVAFDLETLVDPAYVLAFISELARLGYDTLPYGSDAYVRRNPRGWGYWVALLAPSAPRALPADTEGQQWRFTPDWDFSVFSEYVWDHCGQGVRP